MERTWAWTGKLFASARSLKRDKSGSVVKDVMRHHPLSKRMRKILQRQGRLVFLYLDIVRFAEIEQRLGERMAGDLLQVVEQAICKVSEAHLRREQLLDVENFWGDDFLVCFQADEGMDESSLFDWAAKIRQEIVQEVNATRPALLSAALDLHVGHALMQPSPEPLDRQIYLTIKEAVKGARKTIIGDEMRREFETLLNERLIRPHFQPILTCASGQAFGWEALARGPQGSRFELPDALFSFAEESGDMYRLERICRERAIEKAAPLPAGAKLFVNINPRTMEDPLFTKGETRRLLHQHGLQPSDIVFEVTERDSIKDYSAFRKTLEHYRQQGYLIAVDDAGAGYSSLQSIVELCPDFIKMDMSLVRGIDQDPVKQALLEAFVTLARKIKCKIIAEGIERVEEFDTLMALGIDYGQGYLLGRPAPTLKLAIPDSVQERIESGLHERGKPVRSTSQEQIGSLASPTFVRPPHTTIQEVHERLVHRRQITSVVILEEGRAAGLITRDQVYALLGSQYGVPLFYRRQVGDLMDKEPLCVDSRLLLDEVSSLATRRSNLKRYDDIIVTQNGDYCGIVSVQTLLDAMSKRNGTAAHSV